MHYLGSLDDLREMICPQLMHLYLDFVAPFAAVRRDRDCRRIISSIL
jgi:hypothetical protein